MFEVRRLEGTKLKPVTGDGFNLLLVAKCSDGLAGVSIMALYLSMIGS